jgi:hypothetical protein
MGKELEPLAGALGGAPRQGTGPWPRHVWAGLVKSRSWTKDCLAFQGRVLTGDWIHWCYEFDALPIDETCHDFEFCNCFPDYPRPVSRA